jgi:hypothetical protein
MQPSPHFVDVELYADEATAIAALRPGTGERHDARSPLPDWAISPEVADKEGVTRIRPDDTVIRDERVRPGLRNRDLVRHNGRGRLVLKMADLHPFGHPFHDDIVAILREPGLAGGRLAICGAAKWYTKRPGMFPIRVVSYTRRE